MEHIPLPVPQRRSRWRGDSVCYSYGGDCGYTSTSARLSSGRPGGPNSIVMTWPLVVGATSYNLHYSTTPGAKATGIQLANVGVYNATFNDYAYGLTGLTTKVPYYLVVTAVNAFGESAPSPEETAMPDIPISSLIFTDPNLHPALPFCHLK